MIAVVHFRSRRPPAPELSELDRERFNSSPLGDVIPITVNDEGRRCVHVAYVPKPLPPHVELSSATQKAVSEADLALGRLDGAGTQLPNPLLLTRPTIRNEAVSTSALEGTYAELTEVLEAEALEEELPRGPLAEVVNYVRAAEEGIELIKHRPITVNLINRLHQVLMSGTRGDSWESGQLRQRQNWIGPHRCIIEDSYFVPPPPGDILVSGLSDWEKWIHREDDIPLLVRVAVAHYQFETLHPYTDGNGRLGRLIAVLQLIERGALSHHFLTISPYFEARRTEYSELLRQVSQTGDFDPWVRFFIVGIRTQAERALQQVKELLDWRDKTIAHLREAQVRGVALQIAEDLVAYPAITPTKAATTYGVTYPAANAAIAKLEEHGVLAEVTGRSYGRLFLAEGVVSIIADRNGVTRPSSEVATTEVSA